jgi:hypothetical protein
MRYLFIALLFVISSAVGSSNYVIKTNTFYDDVGLMSTFFADEIGNNPLTVSIVYMANEIELNGVPVYAYVRPTFEPHTYYIYLSAYIEERDLPRILAHEFIHIQQLETGRLRYIDRESGKVLYKGKKFTLDYSKNFNLPHEVDAYRDEKALVQKYANRKRVE